MEHIHLKISNRRFLMDIQENINVNVNENNKNEATNLNPIPR